MSDKRREREAEAAPFRKALIERVGECEISGHSPSKPYRDKPAECSQLCVHEIRGGPFRQASLDKPYAVLVLTSYVNQYVVTDRSEWPEARQLAALAASRPLDFDLAAYLQLTSPNAPRRIEIQDILEHMPEDYLTKNDVADKLQVDRRSVQNWIDFGHLPAIDVRTIGASRPLYRIAWKDFLDFCERRRVSTEED